MVKGLLGRKIGMTQIFSETGEVIPVTIIQAGPCVVTQIKTQETDGYEAIQLGFEQVEPRKLTRPARGHLSVLPKRKQWSRPPRPVNEPKAEMLVRFLREFGADDVREHTVGDIIRVNMFEQGQRVDVSGTSKGRGFAGVMKRHGFRGGPRTHGQSDRARAPGSIGGGTKPGKVWKGQRMAGHMGNKRVTVQNLEVVGIVPEKDIILVRGAIPGPSRGLVQIQRAAKTPA